MKRPITARKMLFEDISLSVLLSDPSHLDYSGNELRFRRFHLGLTFWKRQSAGQKTEHGARSDDNAKAILSEIELWEIFFVFAPRC